MRPWTDKEISTLVRIWPNESVAQIATRLHRPCGSVHAKAKQLLGKGLLEAKDSPGRSNNPDLRDFDEVKMDYCRKHNITIAELSARLEDDDRLRADFYRQALAAKLTELRPTGQDNSKKKKKKKKKIGRHNDRGGGYSRRRSPDRCQSSSRMFIALYASAVARAWSGPSPLPMPP